MRALGRSLLVLGWHNVDPTYAFGASSPPDARLGFERQLTFLRRWAHVVRLGPALERLFAGQSLPSRAVALTFDDGYLDNQLVAAPALARHGLPATFFLVPAFLSGTRSAWWEELAWAVRRATTRELVWGEDRFHLALPEGRRGALAFVSDAVKALDGARRADAVEEVVRRLAPEGVRPRFEDLFMGWDGARSLQRAGHEIGSHTCNHHILSRESKGVQQFELVEARRLLQTELQEPAGLLAYPNGRAQDYDGDTLRLVAAAGHTAAVTTRAGLASRGQSAFEVRRVLVEPGTDVRDVLLEAARAGKRRARHLLARGQDDRGQEPL